VFEGYSNKVRKLQEVTPQLVCGVNIPAINSNQKKVSEDIEYETWMFLKYLDNQLGVLQYSSRVAFVDFFLSILRF